MYGASDSHPVPQFWGPLTCGSLHAAKVTSSAWFPLGLGNQQCSCFWGHLSASGISEVTSRLQAFLVGWIQIEAANGSLLPVAHFSSILCLHRLWEHSLVPTQPGFLACYQSSEPRSFAPKISSGSDAWGHCVCLFSRDTYLIFFFFLKIFLMWAIFKVFVEFVTILLLFYVLVLGPGGM